MSPVDFEQWGAGPVGPPVCGHSALGGLEDQARLIPSPRVLLLLLPDAPSTAAAVAGWLVVASVAMLQLHAGEGCGPKSSYPSVWASGEDPRKQPCKDCGPAQTITKFLLGSVWEPLLAMKTGHVSPQHLLPDSSVLCLGPLCHVESFRVLRFLAAASSKHCLLRRPSCPPVRSHPWALQCHLCELFQVPQAVPLVWKSSWRGTPAEDWRSWPPFRRPQLEGQ
nr:uncharacterized protein LOC104651488 [Saimiri boliviensis boliviensis]XP_039333773.1 uncharacterized protein LOC104651488 [Saimiri boliviensis boliviensis]XP_039333774.1 uncharacterized protein LOC104651488 [Saimiri boliviensis boliviensis]XP_039333775.1 uncharacterized protein LOC104651488 [Saimiri boliviensis boliviensis]